MIDHLKTVLTAQFEASLCMLNECIQRCPEVHWEGKITNDTFREIAYHTLFFVDYYLSPGEDAFHLRDCHQRGGDERVLSPISPGLSRDETLAYLVVCRQKVLDTLAGETRESLEEACGFSGLPFTRGEIYLYVLRHVQHHTGQMSAYLRRFIKDGYGWWIKTGWR